MMRMLHPKIFMMKKQSIIAGLYLTRMSSFLFLRALSHRYGDDEEKEKTIMPRLTSDQDVFFSLSSRPQTLNQSLSLKLALKRVEYLAQITSKSGSTVYL